MKFITRAIGDKEIYGWGGVGWGGVRYDHIDWTIGPFVREKKWDGKDFGN